MGDALRDLGWNERWEALFAEHAEGGLVPARVVRSDRGGALVATAADVVHAKPSAGLRRAAAGQAEARPVVGDWVAVRAPEDLDVPLVEAVLPRTSAIARLDPGGDDVQVLAANIDTVLVVHPIASAPNLRRLERELTLAWDSGAVPVVVLTKADLSEDAEAARADVTSIAAGVDVHVVDARSVESTRVLAPYAADGRTVVLLGPSGAGKSTLANRLLGEERQATGAVRVADERGRHTTVTRELLRLPSGGLLIDTPGLRAVGLTASDAGIASAFAEIEELAAACRFRDCTHTREPGCAVQAAVAAGELPADRLESYRTLVAEAEAAGARADARLRAERERRAKIISRAAKNYYKN